MKLFEMKHIKKSFDGLEAVIMDKVEKKLNYYR